jgi:hypothetical protein
MLRRRYQLYKKHSFIYSDVLANCNFGKQKKKEKKRVIEEEEEKEQKK